MSSFFSAFLVFGFGFFQHSSGFPSPPDLAKMSLGVPFLGQPRTYTPHLPDSRLRNLVLLILQYQEGSLTGLWVLPLF